MLILYGVAAALSLVVFMMLKRLSTTLRIVFATATFLILSGVATWMFISGDTASPNAKEWTKEELEKSATRNP
jgi:hypothetical protein